MTHEARRAAVGLWVGLAILGAALGAAYQTTHSLADKLDWVEHTHEVIEHLIAERAALAEAHSLSPVHRPADDDAARAALDLAVRDLRANGDAVRALTVDNATQQRRLDELDPLIRDDLRTADPTIGRTLDAQVGAKLGDMIAEEERLLRLRRIREDGSIARLTVVQHAGVVVGVAVLLFAFELLRRETKRRSRSEHVAKQGEADLTKILGSIGDGVLATDLDGRVVRMNRVAEELTGWTATESMGKKAGDVIPMLDAGSRRPVPDRVMRPLRQKITLGFEAHNLLLRRDGTELPITDTCSLIRDEKGGVHGAVVVFRDVSEVERAKTFFRALVERSTDGITLSDLNGTFTYVSPAAARILGREASAIIGTNVIDYAYPEDAPSVREYERTLVESTEPQIAPERRVRRLDGTVCWVEMTGANMVGDPAVSAIIHNMRDVTERRGSDGALRASEARFSRLSESGLIGIALAGPGGSLRDANDACLDVLGYSRADLTDGDLTWASMIPPEWSALHDGENERLRNSGVARPWEKELFRKDGSRAPVLMGAATLDDGDTLSFIIDLSERKRSERTLRETEEQLRQAQKMDAVGRLAGGVAHDFNNMLSVIMSYSQLLLAQVNPKDPMHADLDEIRKAGQRAADLTRQLLMFSRQQVIEPRIVDLNDILSDMDKMLGRLLGEDIDLTVTRRSVAKVLVDPSGIEQVVMNLVVNARDAMPTGGKLTIETSDVVLDAEYARHHVGVHAGPHVMLAVTDGGTGMDAATRERIFEPFFTTKEKGKGTGLGLATVFGIAVRSGGSVWVYSEVGIGTTFKVYLPCATEDAHRATSGTMSAPALPTTTLHGTETILLVEDEEQVRKLARGVLVRAGYRVIDVGTAGEALLSSEQHAGTVHLLLSDVVMPQMSGPQLAKRLAGERPEMKVLCMSGYTDDSIVRHGVLEAHFAFLQKPFTPSTLTRKVREVLDGAAHQIERDT